LWPIVVVVVAVVFAAVVVAALAGVVVVPSLSGLVFAYDVRQSYHHGYAALPLWAMYAVPVKSSSDMGSQGYY